MKCPRGHPSTRLVSLFLQEGQVLGESLGDRRFSSSPILCLVSGVGSPGEAGVAGAPPGLPLLWQQSVI